MNVGARQRRHRHRRLRGHRAARGAGADGGSASPHPRSIVVRRRGVRRPAAAGVLQRFLSPAVGPRPRLPRQQSRRFQRARPLARRAQGSGTAGFPGLEGQAARGLSRRGARKGHLVSARRPRGQRRHHAQSGRRRHLSVRRRHRKPRSGAAVRRPDPGPARNARQSRRSRRGVRQQWPRPIVQSGLRQDVEAVTRSAARTAAYRDLRSLVQAAVRRRSHLADHPRSHHRDREPGRGAAEAGAQRRQRAGLHDHAAARRRHHADLPGHHRHRECRARAARAQRGAGDRRPDEGRFRPPRVLRTALAADHHHRLRALPRRPRRPAR